MKKILLIIVLFVSFTAVLFGCDTPKSKVIVVLGENEVIAGYKVEYFENIDEHDQGTSPGYVIYKETGGKKEFVFQVRWISDIINNMGVTIESTMDVNLEQFNFSFSGGGTKASFSNEKTSYFKYTTVWTGLSSRVGQSISLEAKEVFKDATLTITNIDETYKIVDKYWYLNFIYENITDGNKSIRYHVWSFASLYGYEIGDDCLGREDLLYMCIKFESSGSFVMSGDYGTNTIVSIEGTWTMEGNIITILRGGNTAEFIYAQGALILHEEKSNSVESFYFLDSPTTFGVSTN